MNVGQEHLQRSMNSLAGLAVGDALGSALGEFGVGWAGGDQRPELPQSPWFYTDDTVMAQSIVKVLREHDEIDQDHLAELFSQRFMSAPERGYGRGAAALLASIYHGADWAVESQAMFGGQGSFGNGAAMRVAPLGAWFADRPDALSTAAIASAKVTHRHAEAVSGAVAVALMAAEFVNSVDKQFGADAGVLARVASQLPSGQVQAGIIEASEIPFDHEPLIVSRRLGNGQNVSAQDTVPYSLWVAARHADDFETAIWTAAAAGGDRDTICAIVGGIVACRVGRRAIPMAWQRATESWDED